MRREYRIGDGPVCRSKKCNFWSGKVCIVPALLYYLENVNPFIRNNVFIYLAKPPASQVNPQFALN